MAEQRALTVKQKAETIRAFITQHSAQIEAAMVELAKKYLTVEKIAELYMLASTKEPKLLDCTPISILNAVRCMAETGLDLRGGQAAIVPFGNEAVFIPMYQGVALNLVRCGVVRDIDAQVVFDGDEFEYEYGSNSHLRHVPKNEGYVDSADAWDHIVAAWAMATLPNGEKKFRVISKGYLARIKANIRATKADAPWVKWPEPQCCKTAIKQLAKYLPIDADSPAMRTIELDNQLESRDRPLEPAELKALQEGSGVVADFDKQTATERAKEELKVKMESKPQAAPAGESSQDSPTTCPLQEQQPAETTVGPNPAQVAEIGPASEADGDHRRESGKRSTTEGAPLASRPPTPQREAIPQERGRDKDSGYSPVAESALHRPPETEAEPAATGAGQDVHVSPEPPSGLPADLESASQAPLLSAEDAQDAYLETPLGGGYVAKEKRVNQLTGLFQRELQVSLGEVERVLCKGTSLGGMHHKDLDRIAAIYRDCADPESPTTWQDVVEEFAPKEKKPAKRQSALLLKRIDRMLTAFDSLVPPRTREDIESVIGGSIDELQNDDLNDLLGMYEDLQEGKVKWDQLVKG